LGTSVLDLLSARRPDVQSRDVAPQDPSASTSQPSWIAEHFARHGLFDRNSWLDDHFAEAGIKPDNTSVKRVLPPVSNDRTVGPAARDNMRLDAQTQRADRMRAVGTMLMSGAKMGARMASPVIDLAATVPEAVSSAKEGNVLGGAASLGLAALPFVGPVKRAAGAYKAGEESLPAITQFNKVKPEEFHAALSNFAEARPSEAGYITWRSPSQMRKEKMQTFLADDGKTGFAIHPESGDIRNVFNFGDAGRGAHAVADAVANRGGKVLDAFDSGLGNFYRDMGFVEDWRAPWDNKYRPKNWDQAKHGTPDVIGMSHPFADTDRSAQQLIADYSDRRAARKGIDAASEAPPAMVQPSWIAELLPPNVNTTERWRNALEEIGGPINFRDFNLAGGAASIRNSTTAELPVSSILMYAKIHGIPYEAARDEMLKRFPGIARPTIMGMHARKFDDFLENGPVPLNATDPALKVPDYIHDRMLGANGIALDTHEQRAMAQALNLDEATVKNAVSGTDAMSYLAAKQPYYRVAQRLGLYPDQVQASRWIGGAQATGLKSQPTGDLTQTIEDGLLYTARQQGLGEAPADLRKLFRDIVTGRNFFIPYTGQGGFPVY
jgi:hypothetical protein